MGIAETLTVIFVVLKVLGYITWSWWLVLSPVLFELAVAVLLFIAIERLR